jgi:plasmid stabilization system protein ParE
MPRVLIDAQAEQDLARIAEFIGETNYSPDAARRLLSSLDSKFQLYASQPRSGEAYPDLGPTCESSPTANTSLSIGPWTTESMCCVSFAGPRIFRGCSAAVSRRARLGWR